MVASKFSQLVNETHDCSENAKLHNEKSTKHIHPKFGLFLFSIQSGRHISSMMHSILRHKNGSKAHTHTHIVQKQSETNKANVQYAGLHLRLPSKAAPHTKNVLTPNLK